MTLAQFLRIGSLVAVSILPIQREEARLEMAEFQRLKK